MRDGTGPRPPRCTIAPMRRALLGASVLSMLAGIVLGATRVVALESDELEHHAGPVALRPRGGERQVLTTVRLDEDGIVRGVQMGADPGTVAALSRRETAVETPLDDVTPTA